MGKLPFFVACVMAVSCRDQGSSVTAVPETPTAVMVQEFQVTIFSNEQSPINRFVHWVSDQLASKGIRTGQVEVLATYLKYASEDASEIPSAIDLSSHQRCPLFMGDKVTLKVASGRIVGGHLDVTLTKVERTPNAKKAIESLVSGVPMTGEGAAGLSLTGGSQREIPPQVESLERGERFGVTADGQCRQKRGWLFTGHIKKEDLRQVYRAMVPSFYDPVHGSDLAASMGRVPKRPRSGSCKVCSVGCCYSCVFEAFEGARRGAWPVEDDANTINKGLCARSFADFWPERYESRMGVKRVWWGRDDERNLIDNPLELPPGSVVVWDICGSEGPCPGGRGYGDIGIVTTGPLPGSPPPEDAVNDGEAPGRAKAYRTPTMIASWYSPVLLKEQAQGCKGKIIGVFMPWRFR